MVPAGGIGVEPTDPTPMAVKRCLFTSAAHIRVVANSLYSTPN